ncbi:hypothetical protein CCACVL1_03823 [Corchorus capsularis]|uniref:Uncharacterized protein n=1 Tax=Corchorus capsularis TaxID=210143 RepID=A0A1R3JX76_COCAP|nr:hypothetical protein CCACVL1_03823 [Corchorus capsularis]
MPPTYCVPVKYRSPFPYLVPRSGSYPDPGNQTGSCYRKSSAFGALVVDKLDLGKFPLVPRRTVRNGSGARLSTPSSPSARLHQPTLLFID